MPTIDQLRTQFTDATQRLMKHPDLDVIVIGALLVVVILLSLFTIWRGHRLAAQSATVATSASSGSTFRRWLTPSGGASVPAEQVAATRARRKSGSHKTIRVMTPVSKVPARMIKARDADALAIARKSGLARDAVTMMLANADPKRATRATQQPAAAATPSPTRGAAAERGMSAPGAGNGAPRTAPARGATTVGTRFSARVG
jgi:hypothetical protein